jgi:hypothetical protein
MLRLMALVLFVGTAHAETCPVPDGYASSLASVDAEARIAFLRSGMRRAAHQSRIWAWSSAAVFTAAFNLQILAAVGAPDRGNRIDMAVGAAGTAFSLAQMAIAVPLVTLDQWSLDKLARKSSDRCAVLAQGERWLLRDARSERWGTGLGMHLSTMLFSIGIGVVLGIGFDRWDSAALNVLLGAALGELQILTEPTDSIKLLDRYRAGNLTLNKYEKPVTWRLVPAPLHGGAGLFVLAAF